jgi:uncharacterized protein involved in outer membrane biogenesis
MLVLSYAVIGFWIVPAVLRAKVPPLLTETLGRTVSVDDIRLDPFALSLSLRGLRISEAEDADFVSVREIFVNVQASSIFRRALILREARITAPSVRIRISPEGEFSFADITERLAGSEDEDVSEVADENPFPVIIQNVRIERGHVAFRDESRSTPFEEEIRPIDLELHDFTTVAKGDGDSNSHNSFSTTTSSGATIDWNGTLSLLPLRSNGELRIENFRSRTPWRYLRDNLRFEITSGTAGFFAKYAFDGSSDEPEFTVSEGSLSLDGITIFEDGVPHEPLWALPHALVSGLTVDLRKRSVHIENIASRGLTVRAQRDANGELHATYLFANDSTSENEGQPEDEPEPADDDAAQAEPWTLTISAIDLDDYAIAVRDDTTPTPLKLRLAPIDLTVRDVSTAPGAAMAIDLDVGIESGGKIAIDGTVTPLPEPQADLTAEITDLALPIIQPLIEASSGAVLKTGTLNTKLKIRHGGSAEKEERTIVEGQLVITALDLATVSGREVVKFESLAVDGIRIEPTPLDLAIEVVTLSKPELELQLLSGGESNIGELTRVETSGDSPDSAANDAPVDEASEDASPSEPSNIRVDRLAIDSGVIRIRDENTDPPFRLDVKNITATAENFAFDPSSRLRIKLDAKVGPTGALAAAGSLTPFADPMDGEIKVTLDRLDTVAFSPYSGRFVAQRVARGKLSLDLDYSIDDSLLKARNGVRLDTFSLGKKVQSPDATDLPVGLAIVLLKDASGSIGLDVPVEGRLDDPAFRVGGVILRTLRDIILKAATAPFNLIGGMLPGEDDLRNVSFAPGRAELSESAKGRLDRVAKGLEKKPELSLEIPGTADPEIDADGLREVALETQLKQIRFKKIANKSNAPASAEEIVIDDELREELLEELYAERFDSSLRKLRAEAPDHDDGGAKLDARAWANAEMRRRLLETIPEDTTDEAELEQLATARAESIVFYLTTVAGLAPGRVTATEASLQPTGEGDEPIVELVLTAE